MMMLDFRSLRILVMEVVMDDFPDPGTPVSQNKFGLSARVFVVHSSISSIIATRVVGTQPVFP